MRLTVPAEGKPCLEPHAFPQDKVGDGSGQKSRLVFSEPWQAPRAADIRNVESTAAVGSDHGARRIRPLHRFRHAQHEQHRRHPRVANLGHLATYRPPNIAQPVHYARGTRGRAGGVRRQEQRAERGLVGTYVRMGRPGVARASLADQTRKPRNASGPATRSILSSQPKTRQTPRHFAWLAERILHHDTRTCPQLPARRDLRTLWHEGRTEAEAEAEAEEKGSPDHLVGRPNIPKGFLGGFTGRCRPNRGPDGMPEPVAVGWPQEVAGSATCASFDTPS